MTDVLSEWNIGVRMERLGGDIDELLSRLPPVVSPVATNSLAVGMSCGGWTAYFDNSRHGTDETSAGRFAQVLGLKTVVLTYSRSSPDPSDMKALSLLVRDPSKGELVERGVYLVREDKWVWAESGEPLPFEDMEAYSGPVRARLTPRRVLRYVEALGMPCPYSRDSYAPSGYLFTRDRPRDYVEYPAESPA